VEALGQPLEQRLRFDRAAAFRRQNGSRIADACRRGDAVDADADDAGEPHVGKARALDQEACAFRAGADEIVRPFETRHRGADVFRRARQRNARHEAELRRRLLRTRVDHQRAGVEVASGRRPDPTAPAPPGALLFGDDPKTPGIAGEGAAAGLIVSRVDRAEADDPPAGPHAVGFRRRAQNSVCAAAIAASVSSEGANTNAMISRAATPSTPRATRSGRSNALAGSSKYMSFTMRR